MLNHHAKDETVPAVRLYELLICAAVGSIAAAITVCAMRLLGYGTSEAAYVLPFSLAFTAHLAGVIVRAWRIVGENDWSAWMLCAGLTEFREARKFPFIKLWILYGAARRGSGRGN